MIVYKFEPIGQDEYYQENIDDSVLMEVIFNLNMWYEDGELSENELKVKEMVNRILCSNINETLIFFNKARILKVTKVKMSEDTWNTLYVC